MCPCVLCLECVYVIGGSGVCGGGKGMDSARVR